MSTKLQLKKLIGPLVACLMVLGLLLTSATPAFADEKTPPKALPGLGKVTDDELIGMYKRLRSWYDDQAFVIRKAYDLAADFQTLITYYKDKKGRDVTRLEVALAAFYDEITAAEAARVNTNGIFTRNAGFNGYYYVLDRQLAGQTILDAKMNLKGTHLSLMQAVLDLHRAFHGWREWLLNHN